MAPEYANFITTKSQIYLCIRSIGYSFGVYHWPSWVSTKSHRVLHSTRPSFYDPKLLTLNGNSNLRSEKGSLLKYSGNKVVK